MITRVLILIFFACLFLFWNHPHLCSGPTPGYVLGISPGGDWGEHMRCWGGAGGNGIRISHMHSKHSTCCAITLFPDVLFLMYIVRIPPHPPPPPPTEVLKVLHQCFLFVFLLFHFFIPPPHDHF